MATATLLTRPAAEVLRDSPLPFLRALRIAETDGEVIISGSVCSYYHKQLAQEAVLPHVGGRLLRNQVEVRTGA